MNGRRVSVYVRDPGHQTSSNRTISVALDGVNVDSQRELVSQGFVPEGDHAVLEIIGADPVHTRQVLRELERWIIKWADKQGAEPIFMWRVAPR
jgi:hypothetical protein